MASSHPLVERFRAGGVPENLKLAAARGALPLAPEDLLEILYHLRTEASVDVLRAVTETLESLPSEALLAVARDAGSEAGLLDFLARGAAKRDDVLEAVVLNPTTPDPTVQAIAQRAPAALLDLIGLNQVRLARTPAILQTMLANAALPLSSRRRLKEVWDLLQGDAARAPAPAPPAAAPPAPAAAPAAAEPSLPEGAAPSAASADAGTVASKAEASDQAESVESPLAEADLTELGDLVLGEMEQRILDEMREEEASEEELRLAQRILRMTIPEKVQLATHGDRGARAVLIRDSAKMVQEAVINSPKMSDNEIEKISNMRSLSEDIMRMIASSRDFTKSYSVVHNLVKNPKTPRSLAMGLMQRLQNRDLTFLLKDKNIPDVVRRQAKIVIEKRKPDAKK